MALEEAPRLAMKNRSRAEAAKQVGCYHCLEVFDSKEINEYTDGDETVICPKCHVDAILPHIVNKRELEKIHNYWFEKQ